MKILTLCGSLRKESSNYKMLIAVQKLGPSHEWTHFEIQTLPYFEPELQFSKQLPLVVQNLRDQAQSADLILISTPEYAHGIPGVLKNSLEWLICEETMRKKVLVLIGTSGGGQYVKEALLETLRTMDLIVSEEMALVVRTARQQISNDYEIQDSDLKSQLQNFLAKNLRA